MDPRTKDIVTAQQNPGIISPLYGASPPTNFSSGLAQRAEAQPNPQAAYAEAGKVGQEMAGRLYGTGNLQGMASNWDQAIQELAKYDVMKEQQMIPKSTFTPGYVSNPVDQANFIGGMGSNVAGGIRTTGSAVSSIQQGYDNAINNIISRFIDFYSMAEDRKAREADIRRQEESERTRNLLQVLGITGGKYTDPTSGQVYSIPSETERTLATRQPKTRQTEVVEVEEGGKMRKKLIDSESGEIIKDLGPSAIQTPSILGTLSQGQVSMPQATEPKPTSKPSSVAGSTIQPNLDLLNRQSAGSATLKGVWR